MIITRIRWKATHFNNNKGDNTKWYVLKSTNSRRHLKELITFENDLMELFRNIKIRKIRKTFQENLKQGNKLMKESNEGKTSTDKTSNMYRLTKEQYKQLLMNSITSTYKKANNNIKKQMNMLGKT